MTIPNALGKFVRVGTDLGVVVGLPDSKGVPDDHYAIWYGQKESDGTPRARTVPIEYCLFVNELSIYH